MYMHMYMYIYIYIYVYVYVYVAQSRVSTTANLPTNIIEFTGFDSSIMLCLRAGILRPMGNFPESLSQAILAGIMLVWRLGIRPIRVSDMCLHRLVSSTFLAFISLFDVWYPTMPRHATPRHATPRHGTAWTWWGACAPASVRAQERLGVSRAIKTSPASVRAVGVPV